MTTSTPAGTLRSPAETSALPLADRYIVAESVSIRSTTCFRLRMKSTTSSTTPSMVENSCWTPSMRTEVMAAPGMRASSVRRSVLPRV